MGLSRIYSKWYITACMSVLTLKETDLHSAPLNDGCKFSVDGFSYNKRSWLIRPALLVLYELLMNYSKLMFVTRFNPNYVLYMGPMKFCALYSSTRMSDAQLWNVKWIYWYIIILIVKSDQVWSGNLCTVVPLWFAVSNSRMKYFGLQNRAAYYY